MKDAAIRGARSAVQGFIAALALIAVPVLNNIIQAVAGGGTVEFDVNVWQSIGIAAVAGAVVGFISWAHNEIEQVRGKSIGPK